MNNKIREAFELIHATDRMKDAACSHLKDEMENRFKRPRRFIFRPAVSVCALLLLCIGLGGWQVWASPVSYVSIDVNPSVELTLNRFDRVTDAESRNEEGRDILEHVPLRGKGYLKAVELLVESDSMQPYLTDNSSLTFTVASPNAGELLRDLESSAVSTHYNGTCREAGMETVHSAHQCGMSIGKYQAYLNLSQYDEALTPQDCQDMTMRQLHDQLSHYEDTHASPSGSHHSDGHKGRCGEKQWFQRSR